MNPLRGWGLVRRRDADTLDMSCRVGFRMDALGRRFDSSIAKDSENGVAIDGRIPVHITYFTAQAEPDGEITTEADTYGHEKRISPRSMESGTRSIGRSSALPSSSPTTARRSDRAGAATTISGAGTGNPGGAWSAPSASRGTSANDIFRQNFGH